MSSRGEFVVWEGEKYFYSLRRSKRARAVSLNVDEEGWVELVVPWHLSSRSGRAFARAEAGWISRKVREKKKLRRVVPNRSLVTGAELPLFGRFYRLRVVIDNNCRRGAWGEKGNEVRVRVAQERDVRGILQRWYKKRAYSYYLGRILELSSLIGVEAKRLSVSCAKTQWGSCIPQKGRISLQWRLALGPIEVADYVVAHEVAHLKERLHTKRYWQVVERLDKNYREHRKWLRKNSHLLVL